MTLDEIEDQLRAVELLTQLRLAQERHDRLFGAGALERDKEALTPPPSPSDESDQALRLVQTGD